MNGEARHLGHLVTWFTGIGMALILGLVIVALIRGGPSHEDLLERQDTIEGQLIYISCLLLIEPEDRTPEAVAQCQLP